MADFKVRTGCCFAEICPEACEAPCLVRVYAIVIAERDLPAEHHEWPLCSGHAPLAFTRASLNYKTKIELVEEPS